MATIRVPAAPGRKGFPGRPKTRAEGVAAMEARAEPRRWDVSTAALVVANAVPIFGVVFLGWQVFPLMLLYWLENVVVGAFNVLRMLAADPRNPFRWAGKLFLIPFFCVHFGMFTFVHGVLVFAMFGPSKHASNFSSSCARLFRRSSGRPASSSRSWRSSLRMPSLSSSITFTAASTSMPRSISS